MTMDVPLPSPEPNPASERPTGSSQGSSEGSSQSAPEGSPQNPPSGSPPTRAELIERYRQQALQKPDPLAANLALINSDLMLFDGGNAESVSLPSAGPDQSPEALQRFEKQLNRQLRLVRQIDRLTRINEELENRGSSAARPGTHDGGEAKN